MESNPKEITNNQNHSTEIDRSESNIQGDRHLPGRNCSFYITNLESYLNKEKVNKEFSFYGDIKEVCVKKSSYTRYFLAYVKLGKVTKSTDEIISVLYKRHGWKISLYYKEELDKPKKPKRHICGRRNEREKSKSKERTRERSRSRQFKRHSPRKDKENSSNFNLNLQKSIQGPENENLPNNLREIFVSNLPSSFYEQDIWNIFFIYGEIDKVEFYPDKRFAFVKFFLVSSANKAIQNENRKLYKGYIIKVTPCDITKRKDIQGDKPNYKVSENNCTIIHVNLSSNCKIASESSIKDLFSTYGRIKAWNISKDPPHVYIQYERVEDAREATRRLMNLDASSIEKRKLIGDAKCNVSSYYSDKKISEEIDNKGNNNIISGSNLFVNQVSQNLNNNLNQQNLNPQVNGINSNQFPVSGIPNCGSLDNNNLLMQQSSLFNNQNLGMCNNIPNLPQSIADALNLLKILQVVNPGILPSQSHLPLNSNLIGNSLNSMNSSINPSINQLQSLNNLSNLTNLSNLSNLSSLNLLYNNSNQINQISQPANLNDINLSYMQNIHNIPQTASNLNNQSFFNTSNLTQANQSTPNPSNQSNQGNQHMSSQISSNCLSKSTLDLESEKSKNSEKTSASGASSISMQSSNPLITQFECEFSIESENLKLVWSGDLSKNNKNRVGVVAYQIRNDCDNFLNEDLNINVEHRTGYEDILRRPHKGMVVFSPQNETQMTAFDEYIQYFNDRQKVGIAYLKNSVDMIYLLAPCEFSRKFYQNPKKHLLGIFVEKKPATLTVNDSRPVLGNQSQNNQNNLSMLVNKSGTNTLNALSSLIPSILTFPPPVVSLAEKRILMNEQKEKMKNSQKNEKK